MPKKHSLENGENGHSILEIIQSIPGIGESRANELLLEHKITKLSDLKTNKKIFDSLPLDTRLYLELNPLERIPRESITKIEKMLANIAPITIAGSYRRGKQSSGDVDFIVNQRVYPTILDKIGQHYKTWIYAQGPAKTGFIGEFPAGDNDALIRVRMDVYSTDMLSKPTMLLFLTGSHKFNVAMRATAKRKGYMLNQYGLYRLPDVDNRLNITTERGIFKELGMKWREPNERDI